MSCVFKTTLIRRHIFQFLSHKTDISHFYHNVSHIHRKDFETEMTDKMLFLGGAYSLAIMEGCGIEPKGFILDRGFCDVQCISLLKRKA